MATSDWEIGSRNVRALVGWLLRRETKVEMDVEHRLTRERESERYHSLTKLAVRV